MAREREKNICPPAAESVSERRMTMTSMMNRAGIPILLNFSMPSLMPPRMMRKQMKMKIKVKATAPNWLTRTASKESPPDRPARADTLKARSARFRDIYSMQ